MNKVVVEGKVAVLVSLGYGGGWYTWNMEHGEASKELLFHPTLVEMVAAGKRDQITSELVKELIGIDIYDGGNGGLDIVWVPEGALFRIHEYDGSESIVFNHEEDWITA